jgi:outer membrane protein assembly factor BamE (lipoprotein component of BamABCDE complex)
VATAPGAALIGAGVPYVSPEAVLSANWSKIRADMDESEVTNLLGPPSTKFKLGGRTVWYYYYPATGRGSVFFTDAGRVSSRQSPFGWFD